MRHLAALLCIVLLQAYATAPLVHLHGGGEDHDAQLHAHLSAHDAGESENGPVWTAATDRMRFVAVFLSAAPVSAPLLSPVEHSVIPASDVFAPPFLPAPIPLAHGPPVRDPGLLRAPPA
jgi:hypothetical protein